MVPVGQIVFKVAAELQRGPDGARFMISLPSALVSVGPVCLSDIMFSGDEGGGDGCSPVEFGSADHVLGLREMEVTASSETFEFESTSNTSGGGGGGGDTTTTNTTSTPLSPPVKIRRSLDALAVSLQQVSVWGGQRNLCVAAALGQHIAHMGSDVASVAAALTSSSGSSTTITTTPTVYAHHYHFDVPEQPHTLADGVSEVLALTLDGGDGGGGSFDGNTTFATAVISAAPTPAEEHHTAINVEIECIAVALQSERVDDRQATTANSSSSSSSSPSLVPSPLFELAISNLSVQSTDRGDGGSSGSAILQLTLDVFNGSKLAWEPAVDPWGVCINFTVPQLTPSSSSSSSSTSKHPHHQHHHTVDSFMRHLKLEVVSKQGLEGTVTSAAIDAAGTAAEVLSHVEAVVREPDTFHQHIRSDSSSNSAGAGALPASYQLHNVTGQEVEVWLTVPLPGHEVPPRALLGAPTLMVASSRRVSLPVVSLHGGVGRSKRAGRPSREFGVVKDDAVDNGGGGGTAGDDDAAVQWSTRQSVPHQRRTLMYFRFVGGQGPLAGPVYLDR